jgi:hypothetical protein
MWSELTGAKILPSHDYHNEGKQWCGLLPGLVLFRLVVPPIQSGVVGHIRYGVYGSPAVYRWREPVVSRIFGQNQ